MDSGALYFVYVLISCNNELLKGLNGNLCLSVANEPVLRGRKIMRR